MPDGLRAVTLLHTAREEAAGEGERERERDEGIYLHICLSSSVLRASSKVFHQTFLFCFVVRFYLCSRRLYCVWLFTLRGAAWMAVPYGNRRECRVESGGKSWAVCDCESWLAVTKNPFRGSEVYYSNWGWDDWDGWRIRTIWTVGCLLFSSRSYALALTVCLLGLDAGIFLCGKRLQTLKLQYLEYRCTMTHVLTDCWRWTVEQLEL